MNIWIVLVINDEYIEKDDVPLIPGFGYSIGRNRLR